MTFSALYNDIKSALSDLPAEYGTFCLQVDAWQYASTTRPSESTNFKLWIPALQQSVSATSLSDLWSRFHETILPRLTEKARVESMSLVDVA